MTTRTRCALEAMRALPACPGPSNRPQQALSGDAIAAASGAGKKK